VRGGKYWTRFVIGYPVYDCTNANEGRCSIKGIETEQILWMPIPPNAIIHNAKNPYDNPIVWWFRDEGMPSGVGIRCYVPAAES